MAWTEEKMVSSRAPICASRVSTSTAPLERHIPAELQVPVEDQAGYTIMVYGQNKYADSLQTTYPDVSDFKTAGGKVIHIHDESDDSIPADSSVHYYNSVRTVMFPDRSYNESVAALDDFYRLFLVPGGAHSGSNSKQPGGGWLQTTLQTVIRWVEKGVAPTTLKGTNDIDTICRWPLRPLWSGKNSSQSWVYHQGSLDSWTYDFDAYNLPLY
ncbi:hypothetical protein ACHAP5_009546 [Fusarium lateritium]